MAWTMHKLPTCSSLDRGSIVTGQLLINQIAQLRYRGPPTGCATVRRLRSSLQPRRRRRALGKSLVVRGARWPATAFRAKIILVAMAPLRHAPSVHTMLLSQLMHS